MSNSMDNPMTFIKEWNHTNQSKIFLRPEAQDGNLYGVEIRFCGQIFPISVDTFDALRNRIFVASKGTMQVTTGVNEFRSGVLHIAILFCNHTYSPRNISETLDFILNEVFPDLAIS